MPKSFLFLKNVVRGYVVQIAKKQYLLIIQFENTVFKTAVLLLSHKHFFGDLFLCVALLFSGFFEIVADDFCSFHKNNLPLCDVSILDTHHFVM